MTSSFVYLVEAQNDLIKIGVSVDPVRRAKDFYIHSPVLVRLIAYWTGSYEDEQKLHAEFPDARNHCEWFRNEGALTHFIEIKRGQNVPFIPAWDDLTYFGTSRRERHRERIGLAQRLYWSDPAKRRERLVVNRARKIYKSRAGNDAYGPCFRHDIYDAALIEASATVDVSDLPLVISPAGA